ncbi:MAG: response regulator [Bacteroidales bacterium]|jgi:CheY-like chemotaxis protein|nr:response regulator [Bacteroidales bacterium]
MNTKKKIVIVDDDIDIINVVEAILTAKGYVVLSANDKKQGIELLKKDKPDLAILDVMMTTHFEGFELAKEIIDDPELKDMPVIIQTSIDVLTTTKPSVQAMAREFRKDPAYSDLRVILVKDLVTGNAGVDYLNENDESIWFPVNAFVRKPVSANVLIPEIEKLLAEKE